MLRRRKHASDPRIKSARDLALTPPDPATQDARQAEAEKVRAQIAASRDNELIAKPSKEPVIPRPVDVRVKAATPRRPPPRLLQEWHGLRLSNDALRCQSFSVSFDVEVSARVEALGEVRASSRPTLTRMAVGSILPGSALIPGLAFAKKTVHDNRELYFVVDAATAQHVVAVDPALGSEARTFASAVTTAARQYRERIAATSARFARQQADVGDAVEQLERLAALHAAGALTEAEFSTAKARVLASGR